MKIGKTFLFFFYSWVKKKNLIHSFFLHSVGFSDAIEKQQFLPEFLCHFNIFSFHLGNEWSKLVRSKATISVDKIQNKYAVMKKKLLSFTNVVWLAPQFRLKEKKKDPKSREKNTQEEKKEREKRQH